MIDLITCWRAADGDTEPQEQKCQIFGNLHSTEGSSYLESRDHFLNIDDAWAKILDRVSSDIQWEARSVVKARETLRCAEERAATAAIVYSEAHEKYAAYLERKGGAS